MNFGRKRTMQTNLIFKTDTPENLENMTTKEILSLIQDLDGNLPAIGRANVAKLIYDVLGLSFTKSALLNMIDMPKVKLLIATAGAGKTTTATALSALLKYTLKSKYGDSYGFTYGGRILFLVYNDQNVNSTKIRHRNFMEQLNLANLRGVTDKKERAARLKDTDLNVSTLHAFCKQWIEKYSVEAGISGMTNIPEETQVTFMGQCMGAVLKEHGVQDFLKQGRLVAKRLVTIYNFQKECLIPDEEIESVDGMSELKLDTADVLAAFHKYEALKFQLHKYDFSDMLTKFYNMLANKPKILTNIAEHYDYLIADEAQDLTLIMFKILQLFSSVNLPLLVLCDEDQTIYQFRGANVFNLLNFKEMFPEAKIYELDTNRRCRQAIFDASMKVIKQNTLRFNKTIKCSKPDGEFRMIPYLTAKGQIASVIAEVSRMSADELNSTAICYRNHEQANLLIEYLQQARIPFHVNSGGGAFASEYYKHFMGILEMLYSPLEQANHLHLYKVLPCSRNEIYKIIGYDENRQKFKKTESKHFNEYNYQDLIKYNGFSEAMNELKALSDGIYKLKISEVVPRAMHLFNKYFWILRKRNSSDVDAMELAEQNLQEIIAQNPSMKFSHFLQKFDQLKQEYKVYARSRLGIELSTFHKLKGLEYSNVYILYLDNEIFPNFQRIERSGANPDTILAQKECENRLLYVAMTRAIDNLTMYYSKQNPSENLAPLLRPEKSPVFDLTQASLQNRMEPIPASAQSVSALNLFDDDDDDDVIDTTLEKSPKIESDDETRAVLVDPDREFIGMEAYDNAAEEQAETKYLRKTVAEVVQQDILQMRGKGSNLARALSKL